MVEDSPCVQKASEAGAGREGNAHGDMTPHGVHVSAPLRAPCCPAPQRTPGGRATSPWDNQEVADAPPGHTLLMAPTHTDQQVYTRRGVGKGALVNLSLLQ